MKITFIINSLNTGGAERVGVSLANGLNDLGHDVTIFTHRGNIKYKPKDYIKIQWFTDSRNKLTKLISAYRQFYKHLKSDHPDIVIEIMHMRVFEFLLAHYLTGKRCPIVISEHNSFERPQSAPLKKWTSFFKWHLNKLYDCITVLTKADKKFIGSRLNNVHVMYNPLFLDPLKNICPKEKTILSVGRIDDWHYKGFDILIQSWGRICKKYPDWELDIIGDGKESNLQYLKSLAKNIDNIKFKPFTSKIKEEYQKASIYCSSSRYEGWGLVIPEAMSQGCATIACDYNGRQSEIIKDGEDGILCQVEDDKKLSEELELLITDEHLRNKISKNAIVSVSRFSEYNTAKRWELLLENTIENYKMCKHKAINCK